jgi:hypothetical protein
MRQPNVIQKRWIKEIKASVERSSSPVPLIHRPPQQVIGTLPRLDSFYCKPVIVCVPHKNCPNVKIRCDSCSTGFFKSAGWGTNDRYLHGLNEGYYLLQFRYKCDNSHCHRSDCLSAELLKLSTCPDSLRLSLAPFYLSGRGGFTEDVKRLIINDALSPKSFEDIQLTIKSFRMSEYLKKVAIYHSAADQYRQNGLFHPSAPEQFPAFSAIDDVDGYNEAIFPSTEYIIEIFKGSGILLTFKSFMCDDINLYLKNILIN